MPSPLLILFFLSNTSISAQTRELTDDTEFFFGIPQCGIEKLEAPR